MRVSGRKSALRERGSRKRYHQPYSPRFKLKAVKLYLEEVHPEQQVVDGLGICPGSLSIWIRNCREGGEAGLGPIPRAVSTVPSLLGTG